MPRSISLQETLQLLHTGDMEQLGLMPWGSNYTFLAKLTPKGQRNSTAAPDYIELMAVYKPRRGETPLWDFPEGTLCLREFAAYLVSDTLGWDIVPPTVLRNGEHGFGSVQLFVENDPNQHFFTFRDDAAACAELRKICVFDLVTNNADRKSGHCLRDTSGKVWAIDHGITFNSDYKLRTVIWDFAGEPIAPEVIGDLHHLSAELKPQAALGKALRQLLDESEIKALHKRIDGLIKIKTFPSPNRYERSVPWPPV
jgi:uncharacterized repeat protein (TIGR03843 family)